MQISTRVGVVQAMLSSLRVPTMGHCLNLFNLA
jgi:hypothetical protein